MGYFSNGTEGMLYQDEYCSRCRHDDPENGVCCPIWGLHLLHNYEECNKEDSFLHVLIPRGKEHYGNDRCAMFIERPVVRDLFPASTPSTEG